MNFGPLYLKSLKHDKIIAPFIINFWKNDESFSAWENSNFWWINHIEDSFSPMKIPSLGFLLKADATKSV